jgi:hypothetical protein
LTPKTKVIPLFPPCKRTRIYPARLYARRRYATKTLQLGGHREVMWSGIPPQRLLPPVVCSSMTLNRLHKACQSEG